MIDFKQRFGLDYLISKSDSGSSSQSSEMPLPKGAQDAIITYSSKVLSALNQSPNEPVHLFDIARLLSERVDTLLPVMSYLSDNGYVDRQQDSLGNDAFQLTDSGRNIAKKAP